MRTNLENVYAAGDIAYFPVFRPKEDGNHQFASIGHWQMALHHGRAAGINVTFASSKTRDNGFCCLINYSIVYSWKMSPNL